MASKGGLGFNIMAPSKKARAGFKKSKERGMLRNSIDKVQTERSKREKQQLEGTGKSNLGLESEKKAEPQSGSVLSFIGSILKKHETDGSMHAFCWLVCRQCDVTPLEFLNLAQKHLDVLLKQPKEKSAGYFRRLSRILESFVCSNLELTFKAPRAKAVSAYDVAAAVNIQAFKVPKGPTIGAQARHRIALRSVFKRERDREGPYVKLLSMVELIGHRFPDFANRIKIAMIHSHARRQRQRNATFFNLEMGNMRKDLYYIPMQHSRMSKKRVSLPEVEQRRHSVQGTLSPPGRGGGGMISDSETDVTETTETETETETDDEYAPFYGARCPFAPVLSPRSTSPSLVSPRPGMIAETHSSMSPRSEKCEYDCAEAEMPISDPRDDETLANALSRTQSADHTTNTQKRRKPPKPPQKASVALSSESDELESTTDTTISSVSSLTSVGSNESEEAVGKKQSEDISWAFGNDFLSSIQNRPTPTVKRRSKKRVHDASMRATIDSGFVLCSPYSDDGRSMPSRSSRNATVSSTMSSPSTSAASRADSIGFNSDSDAVVRAISARGASDDKITRRKKSMRRAASLQPISVVKDKKTGSDVFIIFGRVLSTFVTTISMEDTWWMDRITPHDLFCVFSRKERDVPSHVNYFTERFNALGFWAAYSVLFAPSSQRKLILQGFIEVCHTCVEKNNFNSAMAIMGGLSLISVSRLHDLWDSIGSNSAKKWKAVQDLMSSQCNYELYRVAVSTAISADDTSVVPFLGVSKKDLLGATELDRMSDSKVNYYRIRRYGVIWQSVQECQSSSRHAGGAISHTVSTGLESALQSLDVMKDRMEDVLYEMSLRIQPRKNQKSP